MSDNAGEAAAWALRHPLDVEQQAGLDLWLAQDPRNAGALLRAMAGLSTIERALIPSLPKHMLYAQVPVIRRRILIGMASSVAAAISGMIGWSTFRGERVATARGEIRRLPLADGSVATINTDSDLRLAFAGEIRRVALDRGQAWFQVAKDRQRPFVVDAGIAQVRAIGTAFSVARTTHGVQVSVTEGVVAVWASESSNALETLVAGQYANFLPGVIAPQIGTAPADISRALAWRGGEISLENDTLASAVEQFNRYNRQRLVVTDQSLAAERLVGLFRIDRPDDFVATLAASLDVTTVVTRDEIQIIRRKPSHR
jgi:transmembrane sensor